MNRADIDRSAHNGHCAAARTVQRYQDRSCTGRSAATGKTTLIEALRKPASRPREAGRAIIRDQQRSAAGPH